MPQTEEMRTVGGGGGGGGGEEGEMPQTRNVEGETFRAKSGSEIKTCSHGVQKNSNDLAS